MHGVLGLHRHVVRLIELGDVSYVIKELPNHLVERGIPTLTSARRRRSPHRRSRRCSHRQGRQRRRHADYSPPSTTPFPTARLLFGRGLTIPYLGERVLDAMAGLLVRLHLAGYFWGDCSLSNTLFRRDAGALSAYVIDMETGETLRHAQRRSTHVRPPDRHRELRRRTARPPGRWPPRCRHRPVGNDTAP